MKRLEFLLLLIFVFMLSLFTVFTPKIILVNNVECQSQYGPCNTLINDAISKVKTGSLKDTKSGLKEVLNGNVFVKKYRLHYTYPDNLSVDIIERNPRFSLEDTSSNKYYLIDYSGIMLSVVEETNLPKLTIGESEIKEGEKINQEQLFALNILELVYSAYTPKYSMIEGNHLVVELDGEVKIIFPLEGDRSVLVGSMFFIMSKIKAGEVAGSKVAIIDLQYK